MMHPDKARAALEKFRVKKGIESRLPALRKLPGAFAQAGLALLERDEHGKRFGNYRKQQEAQRAAAELLDRCLRTERLNLFAALFPHLAKHLEGAWQLLKRGPYDLLEFVSKAFRAPNNPEATRQRRFQWLESVIADLQVYREDAVDAAWLAAWAPHLDDGGFDDVGFLLAAAIDAGGVEGAEVFEIVAASVKGEHEIGGPGRHVFRALLCASQPDGWEFIEKTLLAAQRQEGLRQSILESIDEAHPEAFRRMLRLILDHNLTRFSSTVRAVDVWLGLRWDRTSTRVVNETLEQLAVFLDDPAACTDALYDASGERLYLALWTLAFHDAVAVVAPATRLLGDKKVDRRFVAVTLLSQLHLPQARTALVQALEDEDLRVALQAWQGITEESDEDEEETPADGALFEKLERLIARMPEKEKTLKALVWPWSAVTAKRRELTDELPDHLGKLPPTRLIPHLAEMSAYGRSSAAGELARQKKWDAPTRETLFALVGDPSGSVREEALRALKKCKATPAEAPVLEKTLTRKSSEIRRGVLGLLLTLKDSALESADRLLASSNMNQRLAGLELLRLLGADNKHKEACQQRARDYQLQRKTLTEDEREQTNLILHPERLAGTLDNFLGLEDAHVYSIRDVQKHQVTFVTLSASACLKSLDDLVHKHRATPIPDDPGPDELLGNMEYGFPEPGSSVPIAEDAKRLPLREVWEAWWKDRPQALRNADGLELFRARLWLEVDEDEWDEWKEASKSSPWLKQVGMTISGGQKPVELRYEGVVGAVLDWLLPLHPQEGSADWLLDALETAFALVPKEELRRDFKENETPWWELKLFALWLEPLQRGNLSLTAKQQVRLWDLLHWRYLIGSKRKAERPGLDLLLAAYEAKQATETDILDELIGPRPVEEEWYCTSFQSLAALTRRGPHEIFKSRPEINALVERCRARILEMELTRGETPTAASVPAREIRSLIGLDTLLRLLAKLGKRGFKTGHGLSKQEVLTHLVEITYPAENDTPVMFAMRINDAFEAGQLSVERLIELAFLAPQWVKHVEHFLPWLGFAEGVWWFLAHMPDAGEGIDDESEDADQSEDDPEQRRPSAWEKLIRERTPLTEEEREDGAVDVDWFQRTFNALGPVRWQTLAEAARYGSSMRAAQKARYLSDVLRGKASKRDLVAGIRKKNLRESVRLLGLLPLATGERREQDVLSRYRVLQEYRRYARALSPMSKEGALRSADIGLENLARTAGYPDPIRLEWALEAQSLADLVAGPVSRTVDGVTVTLHLDEEARPELTVARGTKPLKAIPPKVRRNHQIAALMERKTELKRQAARMRQSLESAMVRGDAMSGKGLQQLFQHPMLAPMLSRLVLIGEGIAGYADKGSKALRHHGGKLEPIKEGESLRIAHPHDLLAGGEWHAWQHECFHAERVQPFKQVFRELYVLTAEEKKAGPLSQRYAGQQIQESQGMALFGARNWSTRDGVSKTFFDAGLTATVSFRHHGWTPAQVEGLMLEGVEFTRRGEWKPMPLKDVPPRLFSEVMRDLDLVVSVAHAGAVDPEASASTVEMRASLLREMTELLKLDNVRFKGAHVLIEGQLGSYTVHLGSAVVHRQPGGSLCIVPVHAQQRGRLFLPFADDDPKTAEVISKVLLLARDHEIQDPTILDQIRAKP